MEIPGPSPRRLIDVFAPPPKHKWIVNVHNSSLDMTYLCHHDVWDRRVKKSTKRPQSSEKEHMGLTNLLFIQTIDKNPEPLFDYMIEQCMFDHKLITSLAQHLSGKAVERIFRKLFKTKTIDEDFISVFYEIFLITYLKRYYSWFSLYLLFASQMAYPGPFKHLLKCLFQNVEVPKQILQDYVVNIKEGQHDNIMRTLMDIELTPEEFIHHLVTINLVFLKCERTPNVIAYVFKSLETNIYHCYVNRDYGRLLHTFLRNVGTHEFNQRSAKRLIEKHGSEFKAACLVVFDEIISAIVAEHYQMQGIRLFRVQRPVDPDLRSVD